MMTKTFTAIAAVAFSSLVLIQACTDMGSNVPILSSSPVLVSIQPDSAAAGDTITIKGKNFGAARGSSKVLFSTGISATVYISWNSTTIQVKVPDSAATGNVLVSVNGVSSNGVLFKTPIHGTIISFASQVQPILLSNCAISGCHSGPSPSSGFNQSTYAGVRAGGNIFHTNVVISGDSTDSDIMKVIRSRNNPIGIRMPESGTYASTGLPDSLIVRIGTWIEQGGLNN